MKLKNRTTLFFMLGILLCGFFSCGDDNVLQPSDLKSNVALLLNVGLEQTVNGGETFQLTNKESEITFVSQLTFDDKVIVWTKPTLEQTFPAVFNIKKENISITDDKGAKITSADITIDESNKVEVTFAKVDNSYS